MNKQLFLICALALACTGPVVSEIKGQTDLLKNEERASLLNIQATNEKPGESSDSSSQKPKSADGKKEPTEITASQEASFDSKARQAIFLGDVHVKDPQFTLSTDKLTVFFKKEGTPSTSAKPIPKHDGTMATSGTKPVSAGGATPKPGDSQSAPGSNVPGVGGMERAIAEGNVVIIQDKPGENGAEPTHYVGKAAKAEYEAATGNITLSGWPQVQQGINTQVATEERTVMILNRDGRMRTVGASKALIQDQGQDKR